MNILNKNYHNTITCILLNYNTLIWQQHFTHIPHISSHFKLKCLLFCKNTEKFQNIQISNVEVIYLIILVRTVDWRLNNLKSTLLLQSFILVDILYSDQGSSWSLSCGSWIYNYLCYQFLSQQTLWVRIPLRRGVFDTTLCDKVCQWLATGRWFSQGTPDFLHQWNWPPRYNWNIVESGVKHHNSNLYILIWMYKLMPKFTVQK